MPVSAKDRIERNVLRHLSFHARSPVLLRADRPGAEFFECGDQDLGDLAARLVSMFERQLFRLLPTPDLDAQLIGPAGGSPRNRLTPEMRDHLARAFRDGVSVMVTSRGTQRLDELRRKTSRIRLADWQRDKPESDGGYLSCPEPNRKHLDRNS